MELMRITLCNKRLIIKLVAPQDAAHTNRNTIGYGARIGDTDCMKSLGIRFRA